MVTPYLALKQLQFPRGTHVRLHSDNVTSVTCLKRMGSARSIALNTWVVSVLSLAQDRGLVLTACHIAGVRNVVADGLSRNAPLPSEWSLDQESFALICNKEFVPEIDLFATRENSKLPRFVSPVRDPLAEGVDAFSVPWSRWHSLYLFPPTILLLRVLVLLQHHEGKAILVTPFWPNQPWFPLATRLAKRCWRLPRPRLSQQVGENIIYASSKIYRHLLCWVF